MGIIQRFNDGRDGRLGAARSCRCNIGDRGTNQIFAPLEIPPRIKPDDQESSMLALSPLGDFAVKRFWADADLIGQISPLTFGGKLCIIPDHAGIKSLSEGFE